MVIPKYHIFCCTACKIKGEPAGFCQKNGGVDVLLKFVDEIQERDLTADCMVTCTGCLGICTSGPCAVIYPEGVFYGQLNPDKVEEICEQHLEGGTPVEEYRIK